MEIKRIYQSISTKINIKELLALVTIFAFSLFIRWIGVKHGFPLLTHPDEDAILHPVFLMTRDRTLNPGNFNRPDQILYTINFFYLNAMSYLRFGASLATTYSEHQLSFFYYARLLISFMGSLIPIVAYKIGKQFKTTFAFPATLVFALFPAYVLHSLYVTPDIPITLFSLLVIYFTLRYLNTNKDKFLYIATLFSAVNTAEKYPGLISLSIVFSGVVIRFFTDPVYSLKENWSELIKDFLKIFVTFVIIFAIASPFIIIESEEVIDALIRESRATHLGADNLGWGGNLIFYLRSFASWTNVLSILLIGLGIYVSIKSRQFHSLLLLYGFLYWVLLSKLALHWERWALPMYITPLFLIAIGVDYLWKKTKSIHKYQFLAYIILLLFISLQLIHSVHAPIRKTFTDTRYLALQYCDRYGITSENSFYEGYTPFLPGHYTTIFQHDIEKSEQKKYVILSSNMYDRYYKEAQRYNNEIRFYDNIRDEHLLLKKFEPSQPPVNLFDQVDDIVYYFSQHFSDAQDDRFIGPTIEIYQIVR